MSDWIDPVARWPWRTLVLAMLHTLWQGALLAGVLWVALRWMPARLARRRYLTAVMALVTVVACGMFTWSLLDHGGFSRRSASPALSERDSAMTIASAEFARTSQQASSPQQRSYLSTLPWTTWAGWAWALAATVLLVRAAVRTARAQRWAAAGRLLGEDDDTLRRIRLLAARMGIHRRIQARVNDDWTVPAVIGFVWPTLLLPAAMLAECSPAQLQMVIAHELAHVRRWDFLVNFAQQVVEAMLFFNPAVWWISHQIQTEREGCCDAAAVRFTSRDEAAQTLASFAERLAGHLAPSPALAVLGDGRDGSLLDRIKRIVRPDDRPALPAPWYTAVLAVVVAITGLAALRAGADVAVSTTQKLLTPAERVNQIAEIQQGQQPAEWLDRMMTVRGIVRADDFSPLPNIKYLSIHSKSRNSSSSYSASVNADGSFSQEVKAGQVTVSADSTDRAPAFAGPLQPAADGTMPPFEVVLEEGFTARVQVTDASGKPIEGALVESVFVKTFHLGSRKTTTDAAGMVVLPHATSVIPLQIDVTKAGFEFERKIAPLTEGQQTTVQLTTAKLTAGTIVDASTGQPLAGATVKMVERKGFADTTNPPMRSWPQPPLLATTGPDGRFSLDTLRADCRYVLWVSAPQHGSELITKVVSGEGDLVWKLGPERVIQGRITGDLTRLSAGRRSGPVGKQITYSNPLKLENSSYVGSETLPVTMKDRVGTFVIKDPLPGEVTISAADQKVRVETANIPPIVEIVIPKAQAAGAPAVQGNVPKRTVEFRFDVPKDAPPPRGKIRVLYLDPKTGGYDGVNVAVENGAVRYELPVPGKVGYDIGELAGYWIEHTMQIDVPAGDGPLVVSIPVVPAGALHGSVLEPDGSPAPSMAVSLVQVERSPLLGNRSTSIQPFNARDGSGKFLLSPIPLGGRYRLVATSDGRIAMSEVMTLDAQTPIRQAALKFVEGVPVSVTVNGADGRPRSGVQLSLEFQERSGHGFGGVDRTTGANGTYLFEHVNPQTDGEYTVRIRAGADYPARRVPIKVDGQPVTISLGKGLTLSGQVLDDRTGKPMSKVKVQARPKYDPTTGSSRGEAEAWTDADGNFRFANLDGGEYWLDVQRTVPGGSIGKQTPDGMSYTYPADWQIPARGGQEQAISLRVIPRQ